MLLTKEILQRIIREELKDYNNCNITSRDKEYKKDKESGSIIVKVKNELECNYVKPDHQNNNNDDQQKIDALEKSINANGKPDDGKVRVSRSVFNRYIKFLDKSANAPEIEENSDVIDSESDLERRTRIFGRGYLELSRLAKGIT